MWRSFQNLTCLATDMLRSKRWRRGRRNRQPWATRLRRINSYCRIRLINLNIFLCSSLRITPSIRAWSLLTSFWNTFWPVLDTCIMISNPWRYFFYYFPSYKILENHHLKRINTQKFTFIFKKHVHLHNCRFWKFLSTTENNISHFPWEMVCFKTVWLIKQKFSWQDCKLNNYWLSQSSTSLFTARSVLGYANFISSCSWNVSCKNRIKFLSFLIPLLVSCLSIEDTFLLALPQTLDRALSQQAVD